VLGRDNYSYIKHQKELAKKKKKEEKIQNKLARKNLQAQGEAVPAAGEITPAQGEAVREPADDNAVI